MTNRKNMWMTLGCAAMGGMLLVSGVGCSDEPEVTYVPPKPVAPAPPEQPRVLSIEQLMREMGIDERVRLSEADAPPTTEQRRAVLSFFDAFARGSSQSVGGMIVPEDRIQLDRLTSSGDWDEVTAGIEEIRVKTGDFPQLIGVTPQAGIAVLAIFSVNDELQPTMWYLSDGVAGPAFEAGLTPPDILNRIYGADLIASWHQVIEQEREKADEVSVEVTLPQTVLEQRQPGEAPAEPAAPPTGPSPGGPAPGGPGPGGPSPGGIPIDT